MILFALLACMTPTFEGVGMAATAAEQPADRDRHGTLADATQTLDQVQRQLDGLSQPDRAAASAAIAVAIRNCPYNRSAVAIPLAMHQALARHDAPALDGVKAAVGRHVAVLDALGASAMELPGEGDYLRTELAGMYSGPELAALHDPVAGALLLVMQIRELVNAYPPETTARINGAVATVSAATQDQWELKGALLVYRNQLESIVAEGTLDPAAAADVEAIHALISEFVQLGC